MPNKGYTPIRSIPAVKNATNNDYYLALVEFFKTHKVCSHCNGFGYTLDEQVERSTERNNVWTIKYRGIGELEKLADIDGFPFTTKIKEIFEMVFYGRKQCTNCHGGGFIEK